MLDYEEVKKVYAKKLAADHTGRGRMEAAFYAAIRFAYEAGLADGAEQCQLRASRAEELQNICRRVYEIWAGSEGMPEPETCAEAYLLRLLEAMGDEAKKGLG